MSDHTKNVKKINGDFGEKLVIKKCRCWKCGGRYALLPPSTAVFDIQCKKCRSLAMAQVKTKFVTNHRVVPASVVGAAWKNLEEYIEAEKFPNLFLILLNKKSKFYSIYFLSSDDQKRSIFIKRKEITIKSSGRKWTGVRYDFREVRHKFVLLNTSKLHLKFYFREHC